MFLRRRILELIKERGITQAKMAEEIDFTPQYLNMVITEKQDGGRKFWNKFQRVYNISDIDEFKKGE